MEADRNVANSALDSFMVLIQSRVLPHDGVYTLGFEKYKFWPAALRLEFDIAETQLYRSKFDKGWITLDCSMANIYEVKVDRGDIEISYNTICEGKGWEN